MNTSRLSMTPIRGCNRGIITPIELILIHNENQRKLRDCKLWGFINLCLLVIFLYDISYVGPFYITSVLYTEYALSVICLCNIISYLICYIKISVNHYSTVNEQKKLNISDLDQLSPADSSGFFKTTPSMIVSTPMNVSARSWRSNLSSQTNSPSSLLTSNIQNVSQYHDFSSNDLINDEQSLSEYLKGYETFEKVNTSNSSIEPPGNLLNSFWSHPAAKSNNSSIVQKCVYQLSSLSHNLSSSSYKLDDKTSPLNPVLGAEMWRKFNVSNITVTQWNANLRCWISQTILERLTAEFDSVNEALLKHGLYDVQIGSVSLDRYRKTTQMPHLLQSIHTLSTLLPFLELTSNQEYLVKRIRDLAKGGCMSEFKWNGGCTFNGKEWNQSLPTDSAIIMHLFVTYMDTQLLPAPNKPDIKPFSGYHFIKYNEKMPESNPNLLAIHQFNEYPPYYRVLAGEEIFELAKGYNNLIHSILLFLYQVYKKEHGMLSGINLGKCGVNILWVIDKD